MNLSSKTRTGQVPLGTGASASEALGHIFDANYDRIYRFCYVRTGSRQVADDIASETFADAARASNQGRLDEVDTAWLFMVARRRLVDHWRRAEQQRRRIRRVLSSQPRDLHVEPYDSDASEWSTHAVAAALDRLPERQRAALILRYVDENSVDEVATTLDMTYRAAESVLARARRGFIAAWKERT